jgi:hypothetical protein
MRWLFLSLLLSLSPAALVAESHDVLIYGGTPAGVAAALAAAESGERVLLVEPYSWVGGLVTNGLTHTDFRTFEGLTGAFLKFAQRVEAHYRETDGADSPQVRDSLRGTQAEPKVTHAVFEQMLAEQPRIKVRTRWALDAVKCSTDEKTRAVEIAVFVDADGASHAETARTFIDATYEGDLMAAVGVPYRVGRESGAEYGESLAPDDADAQLQAYNFRFTMTRDPALRVPVQKPAGYDRALFEGVLPLIADGRIRKAFDYPSKCLFKAQLPPLPNGKHDINDVSGGLVRLSLPGENDAWPYGRSGLAAREISGTTAPFSRTGLRQSREPIFAAHLLWNAGLIYFVQNDEAVPAAFRSEAREYGWCRDEFPENGHLPEQLYVREARRMVGAYVFSEKDTDHAPGDARAVLHRDAIAMGDYGPNCHGTAHEGPRFGGRHTGEFYKAVSPYQIPYGVLLPKDVENLLVPVAASATHVGFCALRLEPIWMSLGEAAGHAAHLARAEKVPLARVAVARLQARLHERGAATIYVSDVLPGHADFPAVQWWATAGGFHGLAPMPEKPGQRGKNITGQYYEAFPNHAAELDRPLDAALASRWQKLAGELHVDATKLPTADGAITRGAWLRAAWQARRAH